MSRSGNIPNIKTAGINNFFLLLAANIVAQTIVQDMCPRKNIPETTNKFFEIKQNLSPK
jgi:hypothetical protein